MTDPSQVIDTYTPLEYENTFGYLYGDRINFAIVRNGTTLYGQSTIGQLGDASAAWTNWQSQTPDDISNFVRQAYEAAQTLGGTAETVGRTALTVEDAAKVVAGVASVVGVLALFTGIASALAGAMAAVDAAAIKTEQVANSIYQEAVQFDLAAYNMLPAIHDVEVLHRVTQAAIDIAGTVQQDLERLLNGFHQVLQAVTT